MRIIAGGTWLDNATQYYVKVNSGILKLDDLHKFEIAKLMHQLVNNKLPPQFFSFFTPTKVIHSRTTRLASMEHGLYIPRFRTKRLQNSFKYQGVEIWNSVPENLQKLPFNRFIMQYKRDLSSTYD